MSDSQFSFTDEPEDVVAKSETPYSDMDWQEYAKTTFKNTPASYWSALTALPKALYNYDETGKALYGIGSGIISKLSDVPLVATYDQAGNETRVVPSLREIGGSPRASLEKETVEAPLNQFTTALVEPLQSKEAALKAIAEDPVGVASTLSIPFTGGATAAVKGAALLGPASRTAKVLENVGKTAKVAGTVLDPTAAAVEGSKLAGYAGRRLIQKGQAVTTGAPYSAFSKAFDAGVLSGPNGEAYRKDFLSYLKGEGSASEFTQSVNKAFDQLKEAESQKWLTEKGAALGLNTKPVDYNPIFNKFDELRNYYGDRTPTGEYAHPDAHAALNEAESAVLAYATSQKLEDRTIVGLDKLKQRLWEVSQKYGEGEGSNAVTGVWQSVRNQLSKESPEYDALMSQYQNMKNELRDVTKTLGAGSKTASQNSVLASALRSQKTPQKQQLLDKLVEIDPSIAYKVAGASLHDLTPTGFPQKLVGGLAALPWGGFASNAFMQGQPLTAAALAAGYAAQGMAQSPKLMAGSNYVVGRVKGAAEPIVSPVASTAKAAAPIAVTAQSAEKRKRPVFSFSDTPVLETNAPQNAGGRVPRKSGGRTMGNSISAEVKRVRALLSEKTASMLSVPDDAIATALHIAKRT